MDTVAEVSTEEFGEVMATNVLGGMRAVEAFGPLIRLGGVVGVMPSGQGSIANNTNGTNDVYRAGKATLNQAMASYAARHADLAAIVMAPGWIRTELGGGNAPVGVEEAMPQIVDVLVAQQDAPGLQRDHRHVPDVRHPAWLGCSQRPLSMAAQLLSVRDQGQRQGRGGLRPLGRRPTYFANAGWEAGGVQAEWQWRAFTLRRRPARCDRGRDC